LPSNRTEGRRLQGQLEQRQWHAPIVEEAVQRRHLNTLPAARCSQLFADAFNGISKHCKHGALVVFRYTSPSDD